MGRLSFDSVTGAAEDGSTIPPRYQHVAVPYSMDRKETYLTLAFEVSFFYSLLLNIYFIKTNFN